MTEEQRHAIEWAIGMASQHNIHKEPLRQLLANPSDKGAEPFPYQQTFDAIAFATKIEGGGIAISVEKFRKAFAAIASQSASKEKQ